MTYSPGIPTPNETFSASQSEIATNFTTINDVFAIDHVNFTAGANNGDHQKVTFPTATSPVPTAVNDFGVLFSILDGAGASQLKFVNKTTTVQLTGSLQTEAGNQYTVVTPWGLIFKFGVASPVTSGTLYNFTSSFTTGLGVVMTIRQNRGGGFSTAAFIANNGFTPVGTNINGQAAYFFAWGI